MRKTRPISSRLLWAGKRGARGGGRLGSCRQIYGYNKVLHTPNHRGALEQGAQVELGYLGFCGGFQSISALSVKARALIDGTYGDEYVRHVWNAKEMWPYSHCNVCCSVKALYVHNNLRVQIKEMFLSHPFCSALGSAAAWNAVVCPLYSAGIQILTECCICRQRRTRFYSQVSLCWYSSTHPCVNTLDLLQHYSCAWCIPCCLVWN